MGSSGGFFWLFEAIAFLVGLVCVNFSPWNVLSTASAIDATIDHATVICEYFLIDQVSLWLVDFLLHLYSAIGSGINVTFAGYFGFFLIDRVTLVESNVG